MIVSQKIKDLCLIDGCINKEAVQCNFSITTRDSNTSVPIEHIYAVRKMFRLFYCN